jgi:hypothetical protein
MPRKPKRPPDPRTRLSDTLERVDLTDSPFDHRYVFTGKMMSHCPRCQMVVSITGVSMRWLELSCGCVWHPPDSENKRDAKAWTSLEMAELETAETE